MGPFGWAALGVILSFSVFLSSVIFHTGRSIGKLESRMDEFERWRGTIRQDMREISDILTNMKSEFERLSTLIEERTDRRDWATRKVT